MKRKIHLKNLALDTKLSEIETAIAIALLIDNPTILEFSKEPTQLVRSRILRAKDRNFFQFFKCLKKDDLFQTLNSTGIAVNFWYCPRNGMDCKLSIPNIIKSYHPTSIKQTINILIDRNHYETDMCFTHDLTLMIKLDEFFEAQALPKPFIECVSKFANVSPSLMKAWPSTFSFFDERDFFKSFGFGFEIYVVDTRWCTVTEKVVVAKKRIYKSSQKRFCLLQFTQARWPENKHEITPYDLFILRNPDDFKVFYCPNQFCFFNTMDKQAFDNHVPTCKQETTVHYKQLNLVRQTPKAYLISKGLIPSTDCFNAAFWDIECLMKEENIPISEHTFLKNTHKVVSISVTINFAHKSTRVFTRNDYSEESLHKLISNFWSYLISIRDLHEASLSDHANALSLITEKLDRDLAPISERQILYECKTYLKEVLTLKAFAWNGEHYDLPIIFGPLLKYLDPRDSDKRHSCMGVIKRGLGYMNVTYDGIKLSDAMLYFPHASLDTVGRLFKANVQKLTFCYEHFESISDAESTTEFPAFSAFKSSLISNSIDNIYEDIRDGFLLAKNHFNISSHQFFIKLDIFDVLSDYVPSTDFPDALNLNENASSIFCTSVVTYVKSWIQFDTMKRAGECDNMAQYLFFYNSLDTKVLSEAFTNMMIIFKERFNQNLIEFASLPSVALAVLWENYSTRKNHPYSFAPEFSHIAKETRSAILGGLAGPLHIHIEVNSPVIYPTAVHYGPNGKKYTEVFGVDAGSMC